MMEDHHVTVKRIGRSGRMESDGAVGDADSQAGCIYH